MEDGDAERECQSVATRSRASMRGSPYFSRMETSAGFPPPEEPPVVAGRRVDWTPRDVVLALLAFAGAFLIVPIIPALVLYAIFDDTDSRGFLLGASALNAVIYIIIIGIAVYFTIGKYGGGLSRLGIDAPKWSTLGWGLATLVGALVVAFAWAGIVYFVEPLQQGCADQVPIEIREDAVLLAVSGVLAIGFAPITEEAFFRGFLLPGLSRWSGIVVAVVLSAVLFSGAHLLGNPLLWRTFPLFAAIGVVFALGYLKSGNLLSTVLAHALFNTIGVISIAVTECEP